MAHRILGLAKINLRVLDLPGTIERFGDLLGAEPLHDRGSDTIGAFNGATMRVGGDLVLDVVAPNDSAGELARSIERRGEGIDSIALLIENLDDTAAHLATLDVELVNRTEYHGTRIAFIHPKQASGVLIELIERRSEGSDQPRGSRATPRAPALSPRSLPGCDCPARHPPPPPRQGAAAPRGCRAWGRHAGCRATRSRR